MTISTRTTESPTQCNKANKNCKDYKGRKKWHYSQIFWLCTKLKKYIVKLLELIRELSRGADYKANIY